MLSRHRLPVSPAAIAAQAEPAAFLAVFLLPHGPLDKAKPVPFFIHLLKAVFLDIAQSPLIQSIKITGINASICLKHPLFAADAPHVAALRLLSRHDHHEIFKITVVHISSRPHVQIPGIEHALQKFSVFLRCQGILVLARFLADRIQTLNILLVAKMIFLKIIINSSFILIKNIKLYW